MKIFHRIKEGDAALKGVNFCKARGWFKLIFFCGDCKLYFRTRWAMHHTYRELGVLKHESRFAPRLFLNWSRRPASEHFQWYEEVDGQLVPSVKDYDLQRAVEKAGSGGNLTPKPVNHPEGEGSIF